MGKSVLYDPNQILGSHSLGKDQQHAAVGLIEIQVAYGDFQYDVTAVHIHNDDTAETLLHQAMCQIFDHCRQRIVVYPDTAAKTLMRLGGAEGHSG